MKIAAMTFMLRAPWVHSLMDEISAFVESNTDAEIINEMIYYELAEDNAGNDSFLRVL